MATKFVLIILLSIAPLIIAMKMNRQDLQMDQQDMKMDQHKLFNRNNMKFATELYKIVTNHSMGKNIIFSPFSIQTSAAMAYMGSTGETAKQLTSGLNLVKNDKKLIGELFESVLETYQNSSDLKISNKIFLENDLKVNPNYNQLIMDNFYGEIENIDFSASEKAVEIINNWIKEATNNKIDAQISKTEMENVLGVIVNAIYFKGNWVQPFGNAGKNEFWISEDQTEEVEMIQKTGSFHYKLDHDLNAKILDLKYTNSDLSMLIFLPNEKEGLEKLEKKLENFDINSIIVESTGAMEVEVRLPKFEMRMDADLVEIFTELGMPLLFSQEGEFKELVEGSKNLYFKKFAHNAYIKVDEKGVEAAAATRGGLTTFGAHRFPLGFIANHPFFFAIKSKSTIFFMGRYIKP